MSAATVIPVTVGLMTLNMSARAGTHSIATRLNADAIQTIQNTAVREWVSRMDRRVNDRHSREEIADISRPVAC